MAQDRAAPQLEALAEKTGPIGAMIKTMLTLELLVLTVGDNRDVSFEGSSSAASTGASTGDLNSQMFHPWAYLAPKNLLQEQERLLFQNLSNPLII